MPLGLALNKREPQFIACTPSGVLALIKTVVPELKGKKVTIAGKSNIVGLPLSLLLNKLQATVTLCHSCTPDLEDYVRQADIFVSAIGKAKFFKGEWFKPGAVIIDVGINVSYDPDEHGNLQRVVCGDVDFHSALQVCSFITPVPGGVGPMTIAMLMKNIVTSWERSYL